ncbi:nuclear pore-associated protein 1-like [Balaenoptera musculus]|uniref:Nuclear pore-associated protein 1-like n=1 Tax=Balaenoptera musculus TaxID=9771 RepID=A0A8B8Y0U4_BALMU|nr:nuclear pore-associated protein 1-like [Balaenoptera musculus]
MGNLLCKFHTWLRHRHRPHRPPRRGAPVGCHPLVLPSWEAATSDRDHPAAPAPAICPEQGVNVRKLVPSSHLPLRRRGLGKTGAEWKMTAWEGGEKREVKAPSHAMVSSAPTACCSLLLEKPTKKVLGEDHRPRSPGSPMSGKELQREESSRIPTRSSSSLLSTSSRPWKRKIPLPLFLPLPRLRSPPSGNEALTWDRGELPPPPKLLCLAAAKNPGTLEKNIQCRWKKIPKNIRKVQPPSHEKEPPTPICVAPTPPLYSPTPLPAPTIDPPIVTGQPMTSVAIPSTSMVTASGSVTLQPSVYTDTAAPSQAVIVRSPPGFRVEQRHPAGVPVSITPPVPMVPCATPIFNHPFGPQTNPQPIFGTSDGQQRASLPGAPVFSSRPFTASAPVFPSPPFMASAPVFPSPPFTASAPVFPRPPFTASAVIGASAGSSSDTKPMDTTPPSQAVIFHSAPVFPSPPFTASAVTSASAGSSSDTVPMDTTPPSQAVIFHSAPAFPSPPFTASAVTNASAGSSSDTVPMDTTPPSQAVIFHSAPAFPSPPFTASAVTSASAGSSSDTVPMDTTPPSQAVIFQSAPVSRQNQKTFHRAVPSSGNTPPSGSNVSAHASTHLPATPANR